MANTFHQIYVHIVFSVKSRNTLLAKEHKDELHKYITGLVQNKKCKMIAVNSVTDHIHILVGLHPAISVSDLVKSIKIAANKLITDKQWYRIKFWWQDGFGAFSVSRSQIDKVYNYIMNQEEHHRHKTFQEEYVEFLDKYGVEYNKEYLFDIE
jgi:putative transposase